MFVVPEATKTDFEFQLDGDDYAVPLLSNMPFDASQEFAKAATDDREATQWIIANVFEKHAPEAMRQMTAGQWRALFDAYLQASSVTPGE